MPTPYFFDIKKRTIIAVAKQFNNYTIVRKDGNSISVPIVYGRKASFYRRLNDNKGGRHQLTLPAMSLFNTDIKYNVEKQSNNLSQAIINIRKENQNLMQYMGNPSPMDMTFELVIKAAYYEDLNRIEEQLITQFQPSKVISVNLIPEMGVTMDLNVTLEDVIQNIEIEFGEEADSNQDFETTLVFRTTTYYFPPITQRYIVRQIDVYNEYTKMAITDNMSPDAIINDQLLTFTDFDKRQVKYIELAAVTSDRYDKVHIVDLTSELAVEGENLSVIDGNGNELEYVYEYDNGEYFSSDEYIPTGVTANKTGNMIIGIPFIEKNKKYKIYINTDHTEAYFFARDVFHSYNDFNIRTFKYVDIEDRNEDDNIYIVDGDLYLRSASTTIADIIKVYSKNSMDGNKTVKIGVTSYTWEAGKFVCGLTDSTGNHLYIKCASTQDQYEVCTYDGSETVKFTLNPAAALTEVTFVYDGTNWTVTCNATSNSFAGNDYVTPFLANNGAALARFNYMAMYDII